ncbi:hypothetical protein [Micromonospora globbae]|uniref:Uncharacterized protein n=1 Tax=Micromonospora globbae TaxID=1894969 RepID=A0A420ELL6_9ACTN|nr:hypothetical protein [Micromonospora globbae]RKF21578.1 hypothetical protein D7I43_31510 [Micromonospora globbae]
MIRRRQADPVESSSRVGRRGRRVVRRRRSTSNTASTAPLDRVSSSLRRLRAEIDGLVDREADKPAELRRTSLVDVHHQLRLLGQRVNAALGPQPSATKDPQQQP